jgi:hypothetical protein
MKPVLLASINLGALPRRKVHAHVKSRHNVKNSEKSNSALCLNTKYIDGVRMMSGGRAERERGREELHIDRELCV